MERRTIYLHMIGAPCALSQEIVITQGHVLNDGQQVWKPRCQ
jgi:hypothetical protein